MGGFDGPKLNFGDYGRLPVESPVEVEALRRMVAQFEFVGNFLINNADRCAGVQYELQIALRSDATIELDQVTRRKPERKFAAGRATFEVYSER